MKSFLITENEKNHLKSLYYKKGLFFLSEQTETTGNTSNQTGTTANQTGTTANQTGTTANQTGTTTNQTGTTTNSVPDFGSDSNAKKIEKAIAQNENFKNDLEKKLLEEINKFNFLLKYESGVDLNEQKTLKKKLNESDGSDTEKPPFDSPIVDVKKLNNTEWRVFAFGTFPANVTSGPLAKAFMDKIVSELFKDPTLSDPQYKDRITMTVAHIFGGASNYLKGPVMPEMNATYKNGIITYVAIPSATTEANKSIYTGNLSNNSNLAKNRAQNLFNILKSELPIRVGNKIKVTAKEQIKGYNVNTGNKIDRDRDSSKFPVPGQHVNMSLIIKIRPKKPTKPGSLECLKNLNVTIKSTNHSCDSAAFDVKLNSTPMGDVDLGNAYVGTSTIEPTTRVKRTILPGSQTDGKSGGLRWRTFKISDSLATAIGNASPDGSVKILIKGKDSKHYEDRWAGGAKVQTYKGDVTTHADVPYVVITKSDGTVIYDQPPTANTYAFGGSRVPCGNTANPCKEYELLKFNPCATNKLDGDLTGF